MFGRRGTYLLFCEENVCVPELKQTHTGHGYFFGSRGQMGNEKCAFSVSTYIHVISLPNFWVRLFNQAVDETCLRGTNRIRHEVHNTQNVFCRRDAACAK